MTTVLQLRRGTAAAWTSANPTLAAGEFGFETDTNAMKMGDGSTAWTSLDYYLAGDEISYTPTLTGITLSGGSRSGVYGLFGKLVWFNCTYTWGTGDTFTGGGTPVGFSLPVTATAALRGGGVNAVVTDSGTGYHDAIVEGGTTTRVDVWAPDGSDGSTNWSSTVPHTWAAGDTINVGGTYIAA